MTWTAASPAPGRGPAPARVDAVMVTKSACSQVFQKSSCIDLPSVASAGRSQEGRPGWRWVPGRAMSAWAGHGTTGQSAADHCAPAGRAARCRPAVGLVPRVRFSEPESPAGGERRRVVERRDDGLAPGEADNPGATRGAPAAAVPGPAGDPAADLGVVVCDVDATSSVPVHGLRWPSRPELPIDVRTGATPSPVGQADDRPNGRGMDRSCGPACRRDIGAAEGRYPGLSRFVTTVVERSPPPSGVVVGLVPVLVTLEGFSYAGQDNPMAMGAFRRASEGVTPANHEKHSSGPSGLPTLGGIAGGGALGKQGKGGMNADFRTG